MSNWTRTLAVCCALALSAPVAMVVAQDGKDGKEAGKEEAKTYASAKEVMDSFKEFGRAANEEEMAVIFGKAFKRAADYIEGHPDAKDHDTLYKWAAPRGQYGAPHDGYIRLSNSYLKANPEAKDAADWKKWNLVAKLGNDNYAKEAQDALKKLEIESKGDAAKIMNVAEIKLADASRRKDDEAVKEITKKLLEEKVVAETKDVDVYRTLTRIVLSGSKAEIKVGEAFPDWADVMKVRDLDGKDISVADYKGKVVLLDFWAVWCGPCMKEMPNVIKLYEEMHEKGFEVIGLSFDTKDGEKGLRDTIAGKGKVGVMPWRQVYDGGYWQSGMAKRYGVNSIPKTVLIDADGKVVAEGLRGEELAKKVHELLDKKEEK